MKITAFGDLHGLFQNIDINPEAELLICVGDITEFGTEAEMNGFIEWLKKQKTPYKLVIAGNHDHCLAKKPDKWKRKFAENDITYLYNEMIEIEGLKIYGSPYIPMSGDWSFQKKNAKELQKNWSKVPPNCDILITHGPPFGILDFNQVEHLGDKELYNCCQTRLPKFHIFGHVHSNYGHIESMLTTYINCACTNFLKKGNFTPTIWEVD